LSSYVASHHLAVAQLSGAKYQFNSTVYYITLNSNCKAQRISKNLKKMWKIGLGAKINGWVI
jgi:hypothetical protein